LWAVFLLAGGGDYGIRLRVSASGAPGSDNGPATTTVADTVYLADGTTAQGNLIIAWPEFVTASGTAVASGSKNVALGANGALSVALVPNAGATPAGVYYTVVYQIRSGQVKQEVWMVPTTSPASLATVRTTPGAVVAGQAVSMQYVNSALATKANNSPVVHLGGAEMISGAKVFASAPSVPAPTSGGQVATKGYVEQSISSVAAGSYLPAAGGTLTGALTLPGNSSYTTQLVESLSNGGQCFIASSTSLDFYPQCVPPLNTLIVASYRGALWLKSLIMRALRVCRVARTMECAGDNEGSKCSYSGGLRERSTGNS